MKAITTTAVTALFLVCTSTYATGDRDRVCIPVDGTVTSTPIDCSEIPDEVESRLCPAGVFDGTGSPVGKCIPGPGTCFSINGTGKARIYGDKSFSRLTFALAANQSGQTAVTPLGFPPPPYNPDGVRAVLTVYTASASLTGRIDRVRAPDLRGTLYTNDTGVITNVPSGSAGPQIVGQLLKIVDGTGDFRNASGMIAVAGQEVGGGAFYTGEVCVKSR